MKNPAPRFYLKWKNTIEIAVQENNYFLVFSAFLIKSLDINFFFIYLLFSRFECLWIYISQRPERILSFS